MEPQLQGTVRLLFQPAVSSGGDSGGAAGPRAGHAAGWTTLPVLQLPGFWATFWATSSSRGLRQLGAITARHQPDWSLAAPDRCRRRARAAPPR